VTTTDEDPPFILLRQLMIALGVLMTGFILSSSKALTQSEAQSLAYFFNAAAYDLLIRNFSALSLNDDQIL
jgi:hypothetical protein